jgi:hypothetical protein
MRAYRTGGDIFLEDYQPYGVHISVRQTQRGLVHLLVYPEGSHVMAVFDGVFYGADYVEVPRTMDGRWAMTEQFLRDIEQVEVQA